MVNEAPDALQTEMDRLAGYETWFDSELVAVAKACLAELDKRGVITTKPRTWWQRLRNKD